MPIEIEWHTKYQVIDERIRGKWTPDDIDLHNDAMIRMLGEAQVHAPGQKVYLIFDLTEAESMPPAYRMVKKALPVLRYKNRGPMFLITRNKSIRSIIELTAHVMKFQMRAFGTREEALEALHKSLINSDLSAH